VVADAEAAIRALRDQAAQKEIEALLDGEADGNDTFLEVNAGAGGTRAATGRRCSRDVRALGESHGYKVELISESPGEEAGIKSVTYQIKGRNATAG
jgi:peptide chain release factor 2